MADIPIYMRGANGISSSFYGETSQRNLYQAALAMPCGNIPPERFNEIMNGLRDQLAARGITINPFSSEYNMRTRADGSIGQISIGAVVPAGEKPEDFSRRVDGALTSLLGGQIRNLGHYNNSSSFFADWQRSYQELDGMKPACDLFSLNQTRGRARAPQMQG